MSILKSLLWLLCEGVDSREAKWMQRHQHGDRAGVKVSDGRSGDDAERTELRDA